MLWCLIRCWTHPNTNWTSWCGARLSSRLRKTYELFFLGGILCPIGIFSSLVRIGNQYCKTYDIVSCLSVLCCMIPINGLYFKKHDWMTRLTKQCIHVPVPAIAMCGCEMLPSISLGSASSWNTVAFSQQYLTNDCLLSIQPVGKMKLTVICTRTTFQSKTFTIVTPT